MGSKLDRELGRNLAWARPYNWMRGTARFPSELWRNLKLQDHKKDSVDPYPHHGEPPLTARLKFGNC